MQNKPCQCTRRGCAGEVLSIGRENSNAIEVVGRLEGKGDDYVRRVYGVGGLSPALPTMQGGGQEPKIIVAGRLDHYGNDQMNRVYDINGLAPTLNARHSGNEPKVVVAGHLECDSGGTGKVYDATGIAPTQLAQHGNAVTKVIVAGNVNPSGTGMNGQVFDTEGLAPTLTTNKGEGNKILINVQGGAIHLRKDEISTCIDANYHKGLDNHGARTGVMISQKEMKFVETFGTLTAKGPSSGRGNYNFTPGVLEPRAVLTPDRPEKRQNGRRMKEPGEPMFTLTAQDKHGVMIKHGTVLDAKNGFGEVKTYNDTCPTLLANDYKEMKKVVDGYRIRKLSPLECFRLQSYPDWWYVKLKLFRHPELIPLVDMTRNDITAQVLAIIQEHGIKEGMSDSQLYKMAGNGVTSAVAADIASRLEEV